MVKVTEEEILTELMERVREQESEIPAVELAKGPTSREVAEFMGVSQAMASRILAIAVREGRVLAEPSYALNIIKVKSRTVRYRPALTSSENVV